MKNKLSIKILTAFNLALLGQVTMAQTPPIEPSTIEQAVEKVLKTHPELVSEALKEMQRREVVDQAQQEAKALTELASVIYSDTGAIVLGNPKGDMTLVEFIDYNCGYCKKISPSIDQLILRDKQLRVLVKQLPVLGQDSISAAQLMLSVEAGTPVQEVHHALLAMQNLDATGLNDIQKNYHLKSVDTVLANRGIGEVRVVADKLGIQGTPALIIGDALFRGAVETSELEAAIQMARNVRLTRSKAKF